MKNLGENEIHKNIQHHNKGLYDLNLAMHISYYQGEVPFTGLDHITISFCISALKLVCIFLFI